MRPAYTKKLRESRLKGCAVPSKCQRRPHLERRIVSDSKLRRKNTNHFVRNAVEREEWRADDGGIRSEAAQPQAVSQEGDSMAAHDSVSRRERASERRPDPEHIEERRASPDQR